jgi:hypothetical protein
MRAKAAWYLLFQIPNPAKKSLEMFLGLNGESPAELPDIAQRLGMTKADAFQTLEEGAETMRRLVAEDRQSIRGGNYPGIPGHFWGQPSLKSILEERRSRPAPNRPLTDSAGSLS